jgi:hypothetical protein
VGPPAAAIRAMGDKVCRVSAFPTPVCSLFICVLRLSLQAHHTCILLVQAAAKAMMSAAGVPVVPGYHGEDQSMDRWGQHDLVSSLGATTGQSS